MHNAHAYDSARQAEVSVVRITQGGASLALGFYGLSSLGWFEFLGWFEAFCAFGLFRCVQLICWFSKGRIPAAAVQPFRPGLGENVISLNFHCTR
ncbi:MAG: hypothetical protein O3C21_18420, partial [Verrucomicrobia bacterium]|nr:hypothetical protein [Verrucomicrobiota bacterium]